MAITYRFTVRRGLAADWTAQNPVLLKGEFGLETDTGLKKMGDGVTAWNSLSYDTITQDITNGDTTHAPSGDAVFDALAGKADDAKLSVVAGLSANQTLANATTTKVALNTESVDTDGCFDTATGRFTPTKAGLYLVVATISFPRVSAADPITAGKRLISYIYKNGASYIAVTAGCNDSSTNVVQAVALAQMNGTTDYLEMYARRDTSIDYEIAAVGTQFSAIRIAA